MILSSSVLPRSGLVRVGRCTLNTLRQYKDEQPNLRTSKETIAYNEPSYSTSSSSCKLPIFACTIFSASMPVYIFTRLEIPLCTHTLAEARNVHACHRQNPLRHGLDPNQRIDAGECNAPDECIIKYKIPFSNTQMDSISPLTCHYRYPIIALPLIVPLGSFL